MLDIIEGLTYNDLLLIPKISTINSRSEVDLSVTIETKTKDIFKFGMPLIPANMSSIAGLEMMKVIYDHKGLGLFHRFMPFEKQLELLEEVKTWESGLRYIGFSIGIQKEDYEYVDVLVERGAKIICIDVANAACTRAFELVKYIAGKYPQVILIAGTVAMEGAIELWRYGADVVRSGVGSGSICSTRLQTGNGVPSLTALNYCSDMKLHMQNELKRNLYLIADGGMAKPADVCLALAVGSNMVILGNIFSGTDETPGTPFAMTGGWYKRYNGSSTLKTNYKEGVEAAVEVKGPAKEVIRKICEGLRSCCSYQNVFNLTDLKKNPKFVKVTSNGLKENGAHDLDIILNHNSI